MELKKICRFGIPLGSAFIVAAIMDTVISVFWMVHIVGRCLHFSWVSTVDLNFDVFEILQLVTICLKTVLSLSLWAVVFGKIFIACMTWTALSIIMDCGFFAFSFLKVSPSPNDIALELSATSAAAVIFYRCYITQVVYQGLHRLSLQTNILLPSKNPDLVGKPIKSMKPNGTDYQSVKAYYKKCVGLGCLMGLIFESVWSLFHISSYFFVTSCVSGPLFQLSIAQDVYMRIGRIWLDLIGIIFVNKRMKGSLRFWVIFYFWSLIASLVYTGYLGITNYYSGIIILGILGFFTMCDCMLRFTIMYFALKFTLLPPAPTNRFEQEGVDWDEDSCENRSCINNELPVLNGKTMT